MNESRRHHFVPKFLLRPWLVETKPKNFSLQGYYWDTRQERVVCKIRGLDSFCNQIDLLSLKSHKLRRDALETVFFKEIDNKGAVARDLLVHSGPDLLTAEQRNDFARLILSLEARRPSAVEKLKGGGETFVQGLDNDPEILAAMTKHGFEGLPSDLYRKHTGISYEDHALGLIQKIINNNEVSGRLVSSSWLVVRLGDFIGSFILGDRPLVRTFGYNDPNAIWVLPLSPKSVFLAVNHAANVEKIQEMARSSLIKAVNRHSVGQAERFVFATDNLNQPLLAKALRRLS